MHMADALLSPIVGGVMTSVSVATIGYSVKKLSGYNLDEKKIPMMGVMGAFVFAAQMINFTIPGTGSSGHIGGGILLAALLGPFPAFLTLSSVLLIQCLLFADGGLLAYGCNVFNISLCVCLVSYQLIYKPIVKKGINKLSITVASLASVIVGLQIGAFSVVLETLASGVTELPFGAFFTLMQPIHLAIGIVEGLITASVLCFVHRVRPEILSTAVDGEKISRNTPIKNLVIFFLVVTVIIGGVLSQFASSLPDGLEWSVEGVSGTTDIGRNYKVHEKMNNIVSSTAFMPDYGFVENENNSIFGTSTAGMLGSAITIVVAGGIGFIIKYTKKKSNSK